MILTIHRPFVKDGPKQLVGKYKTNFLSDPNVAFEFTDNRVRLVGGCSHQGAVYKVYSRGSFGMGQFQSTYQTCLIDNDSVYINALAQSTNFVRNSDGSITFKNSKGINTLILTPIFDKSKEIKFDGTYRPSIPFKSNLLIRLEPDGQISFANGCKNPIGTYKAYDSGIIEFNRFAITERFCPDEKAFLKTRSWINSLGFSILTGSIILYSGDGF